MRAVKTFEEKATELLEILGVGTDLDSYQELRYATVVALKEQDRDTRHACVESVHHQGLDQTELDMVCGLIMNTKGG